MVAIVYTDLDYHTKEINFNDKIREIGYTNFLFALSLRGMPCILSSFSLYIPNEKTYYCRPSFQLLSHVVNVNEATIVLGPLNGTL